MTDLIEGRAEDKALTAVHAWFASKPSFKKTCATSLRRSLDEVLDGGRTGRWDVASLAKVEKTYIGTKVEIVLRDALGLEDGSVLDLNVEGHEVDIKFSLKPFGHMIPKEAVRQICLLVWADDVKSRFSVGLMRAQDGDLNRPNQDGKRTLTRLARKHVRWLVPGEEGPLPPNFLLHLEPTIRDAVISKKNGQARIDELFRRVRLQVIPRSALITIARQMDGPKRARDSRIRLAGEGVKILCGNRIQDRALSQDLEIPLAKGEWMAISK